MAKFREICGEKSSIWRKSSKLLATFEKHVNWTELIENDDNYKNRLQVALQKEFKVTPEYLVISNTLETGYTMGVYLCLGQNIYEVNIDEAHPFDKYGSFSEIQKHIAETEKCFIFLGKGTHKIKKKAEQIACEEGLLSIGHLSKK